jgi:hypothetical protein
VCGEKAENAIAYVVWGLRFEVSIPIVRPRDALLQIPGARGGMKVGMAREDQDGEFERHQLLGLCAGDGIAIE